MSTVRRRRTSADVRARILEAARELFLEQGFEATTTRQISARADVSEPLLYSNFGNKAELFDIAVVAPIAEFVADYAASWDRNEDIDPAARAARFVEGLYEIARENRTVLLAALVQRRDVLDEVARTLQGLSGVSDLSRYPDVDPPAALAAATAMALGAALLDDLLFPTGTRRPSRHRLTEEMTKLVLFGTTQREGQAAQASPSPP